MESVTLTAAEEDERDTLIQAHSDWKMRERAKARRLAVLIFWVISFALGVLSVHGWRLERLHPSAFHLTMFGIVMVLTGAWLRALTKG